MRNLIQNGGCYISAYYRLMLLNKTWNGFYVPPSILPLPPALWGRIKQYT